MHRYYALAGALIALSASAGQANAQYTLQQIGNFSIDFCKTPPLESNHNTFDLSADARAGLNNFLKMFGKADATVSGKFTNERGVSVSGQDVVAALKIGKDCATTVFALLKDKATIVESAPVEQCATSVTVGKEGWAFDHVTDPPGKSDYGPSMDGQHGKSWPLAAEVSAGKDQRLVNPRAGCDGRAGDPLSALRFCYIDRIDPTAGPDGIIKYRANAHYDSYPMALHLIADVYVRAALPRPAVSIPASSGKVIEIAVPVGATAARTTCTLATAVFSFDPRSFGGNDWLATAGVPTTFPDEVRYHYKVK